MAQIIVRPNQLNSTAEDIRAHIVRIQAAVDAIDVEMRRLTPSHYSGQTAQALRTHYGALQNRLLAFGPALSRFAKQLDELATLFRQADTQAEESAGRPAGENWNMVTPTATPGDMQVARANAIKEANQALTWRLWG
jgi:WXG100 family type VII secretion target